MEIKRPDKAMAGVRLKAIFKQQQKQQKILETKFVAVRSRIIKRGNQTIKSAIKPPNTPKYKIFKF